MLRKLSDFLFVEVLNEPMLVFPVGLGLGLVLLITTIIIKAVAGGTP